GCRSFVRSRNQCQPTVVAGSLPYLSRPPRLKEVAPPAALPNPALAILLKSVPFKPSQEVVTGPAPLRTHTPPSFAGSCAFVKPSDFQWPSRLDCVCPVHSWKRNFVFGSFEAT